MTNYYYYVYSIHTEMITMTEQIVITKRIAKHGNQAIIIVPRILENKLKPKTIVKLTIDILEEAQ